MRTRKRMEGKERVKNGRIKREEGRRGRRRRRRKIREDKDEE